MTRVSSAEELEVCEEVGRGGFGVVYRGIIKTTNEEVAIKQIDLENDHSDLLEINREIQIISECRLPQITRYLGCFVKNYKLWVVMEYVNGGTLFEVLKAGPVADENTILSIAKQILLALDYLHNQGKIHRDLKSQNILLSHDGDVKLTDFGVSTQLASNFSCRNTTVGTPYWMAPEVILNNKGGHSFKADIWSLGCCLYELFTGKPPLQNHFSPMSALRQISRCHSDSDFTKLIELDALELSDALRDFLGHCFVVDPDTRALAARLLKHKFISATADNYHQRAVKKLITQKQLWDQNNHVLKSQNFYIPTEIADNQKLWKDADEPEHKMIQFDISSIHYSLTEETPPPPLSPNKKAANANSPTSTAPTTQLSVTKRSLLGGSVRTELHRILNKVFHKLEGKNDLSTEQYDLLVSLNDTLLSLVTFASHDNASRKIIVLQYLKYFLKELIKPQAVPEKALLQKMILPSNLMMVDSPQTPQTAKRVPTAPMSQFDEVENSLFESWIDKMRENTGESGS